MNPSGSHRFQVVGILLGSLLLCSTLRSDTLSGGQSAQIPSACATHRDDQAIQEWCEEWAKYNTLVAQVSAKQDRLRSEFASLKTTNTKATQVYLAAVKNMGDQLDSLKAIRQKLEDLIEVSALFSSLDDQMQQTERLDLASMQVDLATLVSNYEAGIKTKPSPPTAPQTGDAPQHNSPHPNATATPAKETPSAVTNTTTIPANNGGIVINATSVNSEGGGASGAPPAKDAPAPAVNPTPPVKNPPPQNPPAQGSNPGGSGGSGAGAGGGGAAGKSNKPPPATQPAPKSSNDPTGSPDDNPKPKTGTLTGRILDDDTGKPIEKAVVIATCGANNDQFITRTGPDGRYIFPSVPEGNCVIRAGKSLSAEENEEAKNEIEANAKALSQKYGKLAKVKAYNALPPVKKAFEERSMKNVYVTAGSTTIANDLRLSERRASNGEFVRTIVGFEQSGASSAPSAQKFFFDLWLSIPAPFFGHPITRDPNFGPRLRLWGDIRVTSAPQQVQSSIGDFAIGFAEQIGAVKVNQVAQASEFMAGGEERLWHWGVSQSRLLSFDQSTRERFSIYATGGFGKITPLNPRDTLQVFNNPTPGTEPSFDQEIAKLGLTSQLAGKKFVAFVSQDRYKFYREYYGGIRIKTFYYDRDTDEPLHRFPATLDVVAGQNESITGGRLHRAVIRLSGFYPLPYDAINYIYLFGTSDLILGGPRTASAIILQPATNNPPVPDPSILLIASPQLNRDQYRIGVGIDFIQLVSQLKKSSLSKPSTPPSAKTPSQANPPPAQ